jgi:DNA-binding transcriptional MerR regulator
MGKLFLIGEISKLFRIDIRTLRYYDEIRLFTPALVDEQTGYRYYAIEQFERLNTILYLKALNIPLKEMKQFIDNRNMDDVLVLLKEQKTRTEEKLREFRRIDQKLDKLIRQIEDVYNPEELFRIREVWLPEQKLILLKQRIHPGDNLEMSIRLLENSSNLKSSIFLGQVGLTISAAHLEQGQFDEYNSIFVFVEPDQPPPQSTALKILAGQQYLLVRFIGTHTDAAPYYERLLAYAREKKYSPAEDALEITYVDYGLSQDTSRFVTEIRLPVKPS